MDEHQRQLADEQSLCVCGHIKDAHVLQAHKCSGEAQPFPAFCSCKGFRLNAFDVYPAEDNKLRRVDFEGRDLTDLLSERGEVGAGDDRFYTRQLRLKLREDVRDQDDETARQLRRIADHWPPYVLVTPEGMSPEQWVLKLT